MGNRLENKVAIVTGGGGGIGAGRSGRCARRSRGSAS
jgi:NAD(P)-dependent dehydrogenase (short-subunit alcohol dehydrogenase family)